MSGSLWRLGLYPFVNFLSTEWPRVAKTQTVKLFVNFRNSDQVLQQFPCECRRMHWNYLMHSEHSIKMEELVCLKMDLGVLRACALDKSLC